MSITSADIRHLLSGGASNAVPLLSLGGVKSSVAAASSLFDNVSTAELATGRTEYRCYYIQNAHATLTLSAAVAWINSNTPSNLTDIAIGLGTSAVSGTEQSVIDETVAPTGVTFVAAATKSSGLALGSLTPGQSRAIWLRRTVLAGSVTNAVADPCTVRVEGDTL